MAGIFDFIAAEGVSIKSLVQIRVAVQFVVASYEVVRIDTFSQRLDLCCFRIDQTGRDGCLFPFAKRGLDEPGGCDLTDSTFNAFLIHFGQAVQDLGNSLVPLCPVAQFIAYSGEQQRMPGRVSLIGHISQRLAGQIKFQTSTTANSIN